MLREYIELPLPVRILCFGSMINRAGSFVLIFLTIYASERLGFGVTFATACMGTLGLGSMAGAILGGQLADRLGRKVVMLAALIGGAAMLLILGAASNRWQFMVAVTAFALINDMYRPAAAAMIADLVPAERRPHAFALMYISINLGFAIAPPLGGFLAEFSFQWLFLCDALTMAIYAAMIALLVSESSHRLDGRPRDDQADSRPIHRGDDIRQNVSTAEAIQRILSDGTFLWFCLSSLLMAMVFMQGLSTLPIFIRQSGYSNLQFGMLMSINGIMIFFLQLPLTHWLGRFNSMRVVMIGGVLIALGFGLSAIGRSLGFLALTISIWTLGEILQAPFKQSIVANIAPNDLRARYLGLFSMCYASAVTIGAPLGGEVLSRFGPQALWIATACVALAAVLVYVLIYAAVTARLSLAAPATAD